MSDKVKTILQYLCYDKFTDFYARNFWLTEFTTQKSEAYNFAWLWIFRYPFLWIANEIYLNQDLVWKKCIRNKGFSLQVPIARKLFK
jgi:hypothetical protein